MAKGAEEEKSDGLEIISVGSLYGGGAWDKKYWSSSRGKDRYAFPIGYKAVRTHNGITYQMEIHEGNKGPSFSITSTDGHSCSGQTPDMAWEIFQKKGGPQIKLWRGKRFSCKIDGVEFFGFKNAFVQRLLRELVTHNGVTAEHCDATSGSINEDSAKKNQSTFAESCTESTNPAPLTNLEIPQVKGKRSRKVKSISSNPIDAAIYEKIRPKDEVPNHRVSRDDNDARALVMSLKLETIIKEKTNPFSANNDLPTMSCHSSDHHPKGEEPPSKEDKLVNSMSTRTNLETPQVKAKRGRKVKSTKPIDAASCKKIRCNDVPNDRVPDDDEIHDNGTLDADHKNHNDHQLGPFLTPSASNKKHEIHNDARALVETMNLKSVIEEKGNPFPLNNDLSVISCHSSDHHPKGEEPLHREDKLEDSIPMGITEIYTHENPLDRSTTENEQSSSSMPEEPKDGEVWVAIDTEGVKDVDICVPDSLDSLQDRASDSHSNSQKEKESDSPCIGTCELVAGNGNVKTSETIASECHQGEETSTLNANSEKSDFDSVGEDIKSMMSFLLPQALPLLSSKKKSPSLLKTFSRKKSRVAKPPENSTGREQIQRENNGNDHRECFSPEGEHATNPLLDTEEIGGLVLPNSDQHLDVFTSGSKTTVVPASFISDEACSDVPQADLATIDDNRNRPRKLRARCHNGSSFLDKASFKHDEGATDHNSAGTVILTEDLHKEICVKTSGLTGNSSSTENPNAATSTRQDKGPLSESIICRSSTDDFALQTYASSKLILPSDSHSVWSLDSVAAGKTDPVSKHLAFRCPLNNRVKADLLDPLASCLGKSGACVGNESPRHPNHIDEKNVSKEKPATSSSRFAREAAESQLLKPQTKTGHSDNPANFHLVGCYVHPFPISLVLLSTNEEEVCICVLCGASVDQDRKLFMYKLSVKEQMLGSPSFIGHTTLLLPLSRDAFGREISIDETCLQLTPDGHSLVHLNSVKAPSCREGDFQCLCSACISGFSENTGLKVVQVKRGFVSVVLKLITAENVHCILVCEPIYLIGVQESGILHLWVMNSTWSALIEECDLSTSDCIFPCIVELKRIPNNAALVLGHNGFGEFGLWDICKRIFVARFSSPRTSVIHFLPISLFRWQRKDSIFTKSRSQGKEQITEVMDLIKRSLSKQDEDQTFNPVQGHDAAIWILISTISNSDNQLVLQSRDHKMNTVGLWKLALLVENRVILGSALDHRAAAVGSSTGNGIMGTNNGVVYMWDLSTGTKLCDLHHFQGASVSCIATDDSRLGPLAIAGGDQLLIYVHSQERPFLMQQSVEQEL